MPKNEELAADTFICKCCWKKKKATTKYEIVGFLFFEEDQNWVKGTSKFTVCLDCFNGMLSHIDNISNEIVNSLDSIGELKSPDDNVSLHRFKIYVEKRFNSLNKLLFKLNKRLGLKGRDRVCKIEKGEEEGEGAEEESKESQEENT